MEQFRVDIDETVAGSKKLKFIWACEFQAEMIREHRQLSLP